jgi:four helix bundle protein
MEKKIREIRSFEDLEVWQQARVIQRKVRSMVKTFPNEEKYRLTDQMIRSSRSVARNIAEGYGRYHYQENIQFCRHSRGSLSELLNDVITAFEEEYIDKKELTNLRKLIDTENRLINGYINYLKKAKLGDAVHEDEIRYRIPRDTI